MSERRFLKNLILILIVGTLLISVGMFGVFAEPEDTVAPEETVVWEDPEYTESYEDITEPENTEVEDYTETTEVTDTTEATVTTDPTNAVDDGNDNSQEYVKPLPEVAPEDITVPKPVVDAKDDEPTLFWGFVAWICIGVGVAVILAVLLTTKTRAMRSGGKKRYSTGDKISGKKRLLNDKYYNNQKRR